MSETLPITIHAKLKHGDLWRAVRELGSQAALARHLEVSPAEIGGWCNLRRCPPGSWSQERMDILEERLFALTGKTLAELFPPELRNNKAFLDADKTQDANHRVELAAITSDYQTRSLLPSPEDGAMEEERRDALGKCLASLTYREREIIKLRYGLGDGESYTQAEVGRIFKVTQQRIRQIEEKAMRALQGKRYEELAGVVPDSWTEVNQ